MADLKDKVETNLNENRTLVLGVQILLGFQYESIFELGFERLPRSAQLLQLGTLGLLLLALTCLMAPAPFHRLVNEGKDAGALLDFANGMVAFSLLPFGLALALDVYVVCQGLNGMVFGLAAGALTLALVLFFWYAWELNDRSKHRRPSTMPTDAPPAPTSLTEKIKQVLTETRIVLPGVQALLGFQFITMFLDAFNQLPGVLKYVHLAGLAALGLSMVLLMTPAAYHRLVEHGEDSERLHRLAGRLLLAAMFFFALGVALDLWIVTEKVTRSRLEALLSGGAALALFYGLWFGYMLYRRAQVERAQLSAGG